MPNNTPNVTYLADYKVPGFLVDEVHLHFDIKDTVTTVTAELQIRRNTHAEKGPLVLWGEQMRLIELGLDGEALIADRFRVEEDRLEIDDVPDSFVLTTEVEIQPGANKSLNGLYMSRGIYCTQCEPQGFRRITYFPDRPDVLSRFTTKITADVEQCPVLLANGNLVDSGEAPGGRHWAVWQDPSLKPCYLFALVAGDLVHVEDTFKTMSGREVLCQVYVEHGKAERADFALQALIKSMAWDEEAYGREYDLDQYMIVAVSDFNFGAMENKGLNVFNDKYILADPQTATDTDYWGIEAVVGHEYFHNWSGNRVTLRDWFQISLKEGFTVFREQSFTAAMTSPVVQRIGDVRVIRTAQFTEDAGPMAHPVRPDSYMEISNFYTVTVYEKGAEVIRMLHTLLGPEAFRRGADLYFERHDGQAVTTDDFVAAMAEVSGLDLSQFKRWYQQAGTPVLDVRSEYDADAQTLMLSLNQSCPATPGQPDKAPFCLPLKLGMLGADGRDMTVKLAEGESASEHVLLLTDRHQVFTFEGVTEKPVLSLLRGFSAPVKLNYAYKAEQLAFLLAHDSDGFNRWDAGQRLFIKTIEDRVLALREGKDAPSADLLIDALSQVLADQTIDSLFSAEVLSLPSERTLLELLPEVELDELVAVREQLIDEVAGALGAEFAVRYQALAGEQPYQFNAEAMGQRRLKNTCLWYWTRSGAEDAFAAAKSQFDQANNMTDSIGALNALVDYELEVTQAALAAFLERWQEEPLVVDKWFTLQAMSHQPEALARVQGLMAHNAFELNNPNRVRSLIGAFCGANLVAFNAADGSGYAFLTEQVIKIDEFNPQLASRLLEPFTRWRRLDESRQLLIATQLQRLMDHEPLSKEAREVVVKSLP